MTGRVKYPVEEMSEETIRSTIRTLRKAMWHRGRDMKVGYDAIVRDIHVMQCELIRRGLGREPE